MLHSFGIQLAIHSFIHYRVPQRAGGNLQVERDTKTANREVESRIRTSQFKGT
jgi:hypothetical protein